MEIRRGHGGAAGGRACRVIDRSRLTRLDRLMVECETGDELIAKGAAGD